MKAQREPKKLSFEKVVISVLKDTIARNANGIRGYIIPTVQSTIPECDTVTGSGLLIP